MFNSRPETAPPASGRRGRIVRLRRHVKRNAIVYELVLLASTLGFSIYGIRIAVNGVRIGLSALEENTKSNLTASRSTLYQTEEAIAQREFDQAHSSLPSIYAHPPESVEDPREYSRQRLVVVSSARSVLEATNVVELDQAIQGLDSFAPTKQSSGIAEMRRAFTHMTSIVVQMHAAFDYYRAGVISQQELDTWLGYTTDIGPHPVFLTVLWSWREQHYMSRQFADKVRTGLLEQSERNRRIIAYYYPEMLTAQFLDGLPEY